MKLYLIYQTYTVELLDYTPTICNLMSMWKNGKKAEKALTELLKNNKSIRYSYVIKTEETSD